MSAETDDIVAVVARISHEIDAKRWPALRTLFAEDVDTDYTSLFGGEPVRQKADALVGGWRDMLGAVSTQHLLGPVVVTVPGASATAECHVTASHRARGQDWVVHGHYQIALERKESWRIVGLKLVTFHETGTRAVVGS